MNAKIIVPVVALASAVAVQTAINKGVIPTTRAHRERKINQVGDLAETGSAG